MQNEVVMGRWTEKLLDGSAPSRLLAVTGLSAAIAAGAGYLSWPALQNGSQKYRDIIVGEITMGDSYKTPDFLVVYLVVALFFLSWFMLARVAAMFGSGNAVPAAAGSVDDGEFAALFPAGFFAYVLMLGLSRIGAGLVEGAVAVVAVTCYALPCFLPGPAGDAGRAARFRQKSIWLLLTTLFTFFALTALIVLARFLAPGIVVANAGYTAAIPLYGTLLAAVGLASRLSLSPARLRRIAQAVQAVIPLLLLTGFTRVYQQNAQISGNRISATTMLVALVLAGSGVWLNIRSLRAADRGNDDLAPGRMILWPTVVAIASFLAYAPPEYFAADFFHTGELALAWQQVFEKGQFPFSGFALARGFGDSFPGLLNVLLFDGDYASFPVAFALMPMIWSGLTAFFLCRLVGTGWGGAIAFCMAAQPPVKFWIFLPILLALALPALLARPFRWLVTWLGLSLLHCLFHTTSGIALTIGTFPIALWQAYLLVAGGEPGKAWREQRTRVMLGAVCVVTPLLLAAPVLLAWVKYVLAQGAANEISNGKLLLQNGAMPDWFRWKNRYLWELFRVGGWISGVFVLWHLFVRGRALAGVDRKVPQPLSVVCLGGIFSAIAFVSYSMGRIDAKGISRPGSISLVWLGVLVPVVLILGRRQRKPAVTVIGVGLLLGISSAPGYLDAGAMARTATGAISVPASAVRVSGEGLGLPKLGDAFMEPEKLQTLVAMKKVTDTFLSGNETYLDLTNHIAMYYLLDKKVPGIYAGYYIVTSEALQQQVIAAVERSRPPVVWIGPAREFGSGKASLRSYRLYRWLLKQDYTFLEHDGLQFLVRTDRFREKGLTPPSPAENMAGLVTAFAHPVLAEIPVSWGRSLPLLADRFARAAVQPRLLTSGTALQPVFDGEIRPVTGFDWALDTTLDGGTADFLTCTVASGPRVEPVIVKISWKSGGEPYAEERSVIFMAKAGVPLLVPLGSHPAWLLSRSISGVRIDLFDNSGSSDFALDTPVFLGLVK
jgi:hypothetical protein